MDIIDPMCASYSDKENVDERCTNPLTEGILELHKIIYSISPMSKTN